MSAQLYVGYLILFMIVLYFGRSAWVVFFPKKKKQRWRMIGKRTVFIEGASITFIPSCSQWSQEKKYKIGQSCMIKNQAWKRVD